MKIFTCSACQQVVFFENVSCTKCGHPLAYLADRAVMSALAPAGEGGPANGPKYVALSPAAEGARYRVCRNLTDHAACNWAIPAESADALCLSCGFNEVIPNLGDPRTKEAWRRLERAKRRLLYTLFALGLPLHPRSKSPHGLAFAFKEDEDGGRTKVMTGYARGVITINVAEADDPSRERTRLEMGESYRTLLGHFRHEAGHYYWEFLVGTSSALNAFRKLFGDERLDYAGALDARYRDGAPLDWQSQFVSAYASVHPSEDWAETWAHYLHMVDTLETARSFGLALRPAPLGGGAIAPVVTPRLDFDDFDDLVMAWMPLTLAMNSMNRAMGLPDLYPFVLAPPAIEKLRFVHDVVERAAAGATHA